MRRSMKRLATTLVEDLHLGERKMDSGAGASWRNPAVSRRASRIRWCLNWRDAKAYVAWAGGRTASPYQRFDRPMGICGRAGTATRYYFGDQDGDFCRYGNGADQTGRRAIPTGPGAAVRRGGHVTTAPVGGSSRTDLAFTTSRGMSGSGSRTVTSTAIAMRRSMAAHAWPPIAGAIRCAAARGTRPKIADGS